MRRTKRHASADAAWALLKQARVVHLASIGNRGQPVLRVLNAAVRDGWVLFHGAAVGEKLECLDRDAVVSVHEHIAAIPSYFVDPALACPATT